MIGYTKLFGTILDSTIWREDKETKILWITMLAMAGREGIVEASIPGLADRAKLTVPETEKALACLLAPDTYSRTKEHQGRRIQETDGGWLILNHGKYREKMSADERREYLRRKQAERRARLKPVNTVSTPVNNCSGRSTMLSHSEAEAEAEAGGKGKPPLNSFKERHAFNEDKILWEGIWWFPSKLQKQLELLEKEIVGKEGEERKTLNSKKNSLLIALGVKLPKPSKPAAVQSKSGRPPPTPEEGKRIAEALRRAVAEAT